MNRAMMIWANEHEVPKSVSAPTAQPADMMRFTQLRAIATTRCPAADLAFTEIHLA